MARPRPSATQRRAKAVTFDRCIRRTAVNGAGYIVFCRGIGLVFNETSAWS